jgi:hypothetical protein
MASEKRRGAARATTTAANKSATAADGRKTKQQRMIDMLRRREGATVAQLGRAFGWQPHTVRGALSGSLKKKLGLKIVSERPEGSARIYRIA